MKFLSNWIKSKVKTKILQALTFVTSHVFTWGTNKKPSTTSAVIHVNDSSVTGFYGIKPRSPSQWNVKRTSQSFTRMLRETFRWRKSFDCGFRNNGDLCPDMAPFGQIIGLRQVISEELQNENDDQLSGKSVFEEFLFYIGFLLLLILSEVRCQWSSGWHLTLKCMHILSSRRLRDDFWHGPFSMVNTNVTW